MQALPAFGALSCHRPETSTGFQTFFEYQHSNLSKERTIKHHFMQAVLGHLTFSEYHHSNSCGKKDDRATIYKRCGPITDKKLVANRFDELVAKYYVPHAQQENLQEQAEPNFRTED